MYNLSDQNLDGKYLYPRIPENYFTRKGYEDKTTKRVCFSPSISKCLMAASSHIKGKEFYVHVPDGKYSVYKPTTKEVPDCKITGELWVTQPVKLKCIGKILCTDAKDKPGHLYEYREDDYSILYEWNYKWLEKYK